jgi:hypothetical protein
MPAVERGQQAVDSKQNDRRDRSGYAPNEKNAERTNTTLPI